MQIFFPNPQPPKPDSERRLKEKEMLKALLPFFPEPIQFNDIVEHLRENIRTVKQCGRLVMLGEVGLDGAARVIWPKEARGLYDEQTRTLRRGQSSSNSTPGNETGEQGTALEGGDGDGEWKRLTPFKISMDHQKKILRAQMKVAIEFGVPVSLHCVAAPGECCIVVSYLHLSSPNQ